MPYRRGRKSAAQTPAPRSERIKGSKKNPKGTAASQSSAAKIVLSDKTIKALSKKAKEYNKTHKSSVSLNTLKAVYRRGLGAYSSSHRPTITGGVPNTRNAWAMARVNKFLMKKAGKKVKAAYVQDDDLLARGGNVFDDKQLLKRYKQGKSIGFSAEAHLKAKGLLPRADGTKRKSEKYKRTYAKRIAKTYSKGGLIAPNGKKSNLTPQQYKLVRTPEFKAWFGDWENDPENASKVVDFNGEPLVVYHGSHKRFNIFDESKSGSNVGREIIGFYFTDYRLVADLYTYHDEQEKYLGKKYVREFFLNIRKLKTTDTSDKFGGEGYWEDTYDELILKSKKQGFDGVRLKNIVDTLQGPKKGKELFEYAADTFVVFNPNQIKLADGTNTTFDGSNPDIRFEEGGLIAPNGKRSNLTPEQYKLVRTPEFKAWFGDWENDTKNASKVVDENGEPKVVSHSTRKLTDESGNYIDSNPIDVFEQSNYSFSTPKTTAKPIWFSYEGVYMDEKVYKEIINIKLFLNIRNLFDFNNKNQVNSLMSYATKNYSWADGINDVDFTSINYETIEAYRIPALIKEMGYNGYKTNEENAIVIFESEQAKLADGTNTTFDANNPDIRFAKGGGVTISNEDYTFYVGGEDYTGKAIKLDGNTVGGIAYDDDDNEIQGITIKNKYRNKGIAKKAIKTIFDNNKKLRRVYVRAIPKAKKFWEKIGTDFDEYNDDAGLWEGYLERFEDGGFSDELIVCSNCLWSWKASESTPEEKYICHKCGQDNTPTMDKITMDVPLFIRLLEFAREDAKDDMELHTLTENALKLGDKTLTMEDYQKIVFSKTTSPKITKSTYSVVEFPTIEEEFADGGVVVGKRHSESDENGTGEKFLVQSTGQIVELEGGEGVLCKESMQSKKIYKFEGKEMTGRQIASFLNHKYGGVEFAKGGQVDEKSVCGCRSMYYHGGELPSATLDSLQGGEAVVTVKTMESKDKFSFQGRQMTPRKILSHINQESGGKKFEDGGIIDLTEHHLKNATKMVKMINFTEKIFYF